MREIRAPVPWNFAAAYLADVVTDFLSQYPQSQVERVGLLKISQVTAFWNPVHVDNRVDEVIH